MSDTSNGNVIFIRDARWSVEAGAEQIAAKVRSGSVNHFITICEDSAGNFEYQLWGGPMNVDRLLRYAEEFRLWADRIITENRTARRP